MRSHLGWFATCACVCLGIGFFALLRAQQSVANPQPAAAPAPIVLHYRESPIFSGPHEHWVTVVAFSPDRTTLATASNDGFVRLWDSTTGRLLQMLGDDATRGINAVAFSPDGSQLAMVGGFLGLDVVVWNVETGQIARTFEEYVSPTHSPAASAVPLTKEASAEDIPMIYKGKRTALNRINAVAFSPNGQILATGGDEVILRDAKTGGIVRELKHPVKVIKGLAYFADGKKLVTAASDGKVRLWTLPDGTLETTLFGPQTAVNAVAVSPDGSRIVGVTSGVESPFGKRGLLAGGHVWQWILSTGKARKTTIGNRSGASVAFITNTTVAVGASRDVLLVDLQITDATYKPRQLGSHSQDVLAVAASSDGMKVASGGADRTADVINVSKEKLLFRTPGLTDVIASVASSNDGKRFVTATCDVRFSNRSLDPDDPFALRYKEFFSAEANANRCQPSEVRVWSTEDGRLAHRLALESSQVTAIRCIPKSNWLAIAGWIPEKKGMLSLWDMSTARRVQELEVGTTEVTCLSAALDGRSFASGDAEGNVDLWKVQNAAKKRTFQMGRRIVGLALSSDSKLVAIADDNRTIRICDAVEGTVVMKLNSRSNIRSLVFSPDDAMLAGGTQDPGMELWDWRSGKPSRTLVVPADHFATMPGFVDFSPNGRFVVCGGHGKNIAIFEVATGNLSGELAGHFHAPTAAAFLPDGRLVSGAEERTTRLWDVDHQKLLATWVSVPADDPRGWHDEWVGYTASGQFVGSQDNERLIGWMSGGDVIAKEVPGRRHRVENLFQDLATPIATPK